MSPKSHKSEYTILAILGLVTAIVLLGMAWSGIVREQRGGRTGVRTTRSANDDGLLVCYTLFERLGLPVERSNRMLLSDQLDGVGTVFLIDPIVPVGAAEIADLGAWVARGGVLVTTEVIDDSVAPRCEARRGDAAASSTPCAAGGAGAVHGGARRSAVAAAGARRLGHVLRDEHRTCTQTAGPERPDGLLEPLFTEGRGVRIAQGKVGRGRLILLSDSSFLANVQYRPGRQCRAGGQSRLLRAGRRGRSERSCSTSIISAPGLRSGAGRPGRHALHHQPRLGGARSDRRGYPVPLLQGPAVRSPARLRPAAAPLEAGVRAGRGRHVSGRRCASPDAPADLHVVPPATDDSDRPGRRHARTASWPRNWPAAAGRMRRTINASSMSAIGLLSQPTDIPTAAHGSRRATWHA